MKNASLPDSLHTDENIKMNFRGKILVGSQEFGRCGWRHDYHDRGSE